MEAYRCAERAVHAAIADRFGLASALPVSVVVADEVLLATEARDMMGIPPAPWHLSHAPRRDAIHPWFPATAERTFLDRYAALTERRT